MNRTGVELVSGYRRRITATANIAAAPIAMGSQKSEKIWRHKAVMEMPAKIWI